MNDPILGNALENLRNVSVTGLQRNTLINLMSNMWLRTNTPKMLTLSI